MTGNDKPLTADEIFGRDDRQLKRIEIPEWEGYVYIRILSSQERDKLELALSDAQGKLKRNVGNIRAAVVAKAVCNDKGELIFTDSDVDKLGDKSSVVIERIFGAVLQHNAMTAEEVEDLSKN